MAIDREHPVVSKRRSAMARWCDPVLLSLAVVVTSVLPMIKEPQFYFWDDTAASFTPIYRRMGDLVTSGEFPLLQVDMWRAGNFPAEAATGIYNPVVLILTAITAAINNLALAAWAFKVPFLLLLALGVFYLAQDFGATRSISVLVGYAAPFAGFTLWSEATTWVTGLLILSFYPWVWRGARRLVRGEGGVLALIVPAALCLTVGNPYALFTVATALGSVLVEGWLNGVRKRLWLVIGSGAVALLVEIPVLLPFVLSYRVGYREPGAVYNDDFLRPGFTDFIGMSNPAYLPWMKAFGLEYLSYPGVYLAWFVVPLLAWVAWQRVPEMLRTRFSLAVTSAVWLLLVLAPSYLSFFRWPIRLLPYLYLSVLLFWSVAMSVAFAHDHRRNRWLASSALILFAGWLGFGERPSGVAWQLLMLGLTTGFTALLVVALRSRAPTVALVGVPLTFLIVAAQLFHFPNNSNVANYQFPTDQTALQERFADDGRTLQIAMLPVPSREAYNHVLFGSMQSVAGRESPNAYSGIGFKKMDTALCMSYNGQACPELFDKLFEPPSGENRSLADLLGLEQVVVGKWTRPEISEPPGWRLDEEDDLVYVLRRKVMLDPALGTVTSASDGVSVMSLGVDAHGREEFVVEKKSPPGRLTLARLAWPGYRAQVDGVPVGIGENAQGLLEVELPEGMRQGTLSVYWTVPGARTGAMAALLAIVVTAFLVVSERRMRPTRR